MNISLLKKQIPLAIALLFVAVSGSFGQKYVLNEDFTSTTGTNPPMGWKSSAALGEATDVWHFDNPNGRSLQYPFIGNAAIFDSKGFSDDSKPEEVSLETKFFDCSGSGNALLVFHHWFVPQKSGVGKVEVWNGTRWIEVAQYKDSTSNPQYQVINVSTAIGGVSDAKVRFRWVGNGAGWWAIDNCKIYAPLNIDPALGCISSPTMPLAPGKHDVKVDLSNLGLEKLTTLKINWEINGKVQTPFSWSGNLALGEVIKNVTVGSYTFNTNEKVNLRVWITEPNGKVDQNSQNNELSTKLSCSLSGIYTIGGINPDFQNFTEATSALNSAGVCGAVIFKIRNGIYDEPISIKNILGVSSTNTILFESETGDTTKCTIVSTKNTTSLRLNESSYIKFSKIRFGDNSNTYYINAANSSNIVFENCQVFRADITFTNTDNIQIKSSDISIYMGFRISNCTDLSMQLNTIKMNYWGTITLYGIQNTTIEHNRLYPKLIINCSIASAFASIKDNSLFGGISIASVDNPKSFTLEKNSISSLNNSAVELISRCNSVEISSNRISSSSNSDIIVISKESQNISIANNFIVGNGTNSTGMVIDGSNHRIVYNSVNILNSDFTSAAITLNNGTNQLIKNNIFVNNGSGLAANFNIALIGSDVNNNDYFSTGPIIFKFKESLIDNINTWQTTISGDFASLNINPAFASTTDLSINNSTLSKAGVPIDGVFYDIDMTLRSSTTPDIGARNYVGCSNDAGINGIVGITKAIKAGPYNIKVILANHGTLPLKSVNLCWSINGVKQTPVVWKGALASATSAEATLGTYTFKAGIVYEITTWTEKPNGQDDCKLGNDAFKLSNISTALIGTYTIGGVNPDFKNYTEAVAILNSVGIAGAVTFKVRDGDYNEQISIAEIKGISSLNTITFEGESGDATRNNLSFSNMFLKVSNVPFLRFINIGFGSSSNFFATLEINNSSDIIFEKCAFNSCSSIIKECKGVSITQSAQNFGDITIIGCQGVTINANNLNGNSIVLSVFASNNLEITGNTWSSLIKITGVSNASTKCLFNNNIGDEGLLQLVGIIGNNEFVVKNNKLTAYMAWDGSGNMGPKDAISLYDGCSGIQLIGNRILNYNSGYGITISNNSNTIFLVNNFIYTNATEYAALMIGGTGHSLLYNSVIGSPGSAIKITNGDGLIIKNNAVACNGGYAVTCDGNLGGDNVSHNAYYSTKTAFQYKGVDIADIESWKNATSSDKSSIQQNPMFASEIDMSCGNPALKGAGTPISSVTVDIDEEPRDNTKPDIGAKNISNCDNDANLVKILGLDTPITASVKELKATIANNGAKALTTLTINWQVNGVKQPAILWKGNLATGREEIVPIGVLSIVFGKTYNIKVWCESPNHSDDCAPQNNQIVLSNISTPLAGTYTIGGTKPDFESFASAISVLNSAGVCGPVKFLVREGDYYEKLTINEILGNSSGNTIVFEGESKDSSKTTLYANDWDMMGGILFKLNNANHITFNRLSFNCSSFYGTFNIENSKKVNFINCAITIPDFSALNSNLKLSNCNLTFQSEMVVDKASVITIESCEIKAGFQMAIYNSDAIQLINNRLNSSVSIQRVTNTKATVNISRNTFFTGGLSLYNIVKTSNTMIENNTFYQNSSGINMDQCESLQIIGNAIHNASNTSAIFIGDDCNNTSLVNNFVSIAGVNESYGIQVGGSNNRILFNSINNLNTNPVSSAILVTKANDLVLKNNIIASTGKGLAFRVKEKLTGAQLDYNNYFTAGASLFDYKGKTIKTLSEWGSTVGGDANSLNFDPLFASDTIPRTYQRYLNGAGIPIGGVNLDIDQQIRDDAAPDMGADEFVADFGITRLISPTLGCNLTSTEKVKVNVRQFGDIPFRNLKVGYSINNKAPKFETIPGSINNDIEYTFNGAEDLSTNGVYSFKIWLVNATDDNQNNDTLYVERYKKPAPTVDFSFTTACAYQEVKFNGTASINVGSIAKYEWDFGDKAASNIQSPNHIYDRSKTYPVNLKAYSNEGCYSEVTKDVALKPTPVADFTFNDVCFGETVILKNSTTATDGTPSYSWTFADGATSTEANPTHLFSNSGDHKITLTAKGASGCMAQKIDTVTVLNQIKVNVKVSSDTAKVTPSGGKAPYTIEWSNGESGEEISGLKNGEYSVTVSDAMSCSSTEIFKIDLPKLTYTISHTDASCATCNDGTASVNVNGGVKPYYFQWSNGRNTKDISSLAPGKYYIIIYDAYLNGVKDSVTIAALNGTEPTAPTVQASEIVASNQLGSAIDLTWKRGNGKACAVFVHAGTANSPTPANLVSYSANTKIGMGDQVNQSGWFCVSNGTNNSVTITGLSAQTDYLAMVFEYNGGSGQEKYLTTTANGNPTTFKLTNQKQDQTITFNPIATVKVGDVDFALTAKASSGLLVSYTSSNTDVATINDGIVHIITAGKTTITASQAGNEIYNAAQNVTQELMVGSAVVPSSLSVSATELTLAAAEGSYVTFTISSNVSWHVNGDKDWITITPSDGSNDGSVKVTAKANSLTAPRTATIVVTGVDVDAKTIVVTQVAKSGTPILTVSPSSINLVGEANATATVTIQANIAWVAKSNQSWLIIDKEDGSGDATINLTTTAKTYQNRRTAQVTVSGGGVATRVVTVTQVFGSTLLLEVSPTNLSLGADTDLSSSFNVTSNIDWQVQCNEKWITLDRKNGKDNATISVTGTPNSSNATRNATITITGYGTPSKTVTVVQPAMPFINANPTSIVLQANGNCNANMSITSNITWSATCDLDWITLDKNSGEGSATIVVSATNNQLTASRGGVLTISSALGERTVEITQLGSPTGVDEITVSDVTIAPNPVADYMVILRPGNYTNALISIYNQDGKLLYNSTLTGERLEIDMSSYSSGIYLVKVVDKTGVSTHKVIKQ